MMPVKGNGQRYHKNTQKSYFRVIREKMSKEENCLLFLKLLNIMHLFVSFQKNVA